MHTYRKSGKNNDTLYTVGFEQYQGEDIYPWRIIKEFKDERDAAAFASYLNGGERVAVLDDPGVDRYA